MVYKIQFDWQYLGYTILPHMRNHSEAPLWRTLWPSHSRPGHTTHCLCLPELKWWESKNKLNFHSYNNFNEKQRERQTGKHRRRQTNRGWAERAWEWDSIVLILVRFWLPAGLYLSALIASSAYLSACSKSFSCKTPKQTTVYNLYQSKNWSFLHIFKIFLLDSISLKQ